MTLIPIQDCQHRDTHHCGWQGVCPAKCSRKEFYDEYMADEPEDDSVDQDEVVG